MAAGQADRGLPENVHFSSNINELSNRLHTESVQPAVDSL
jgi:hypothetical protein